MTLEARALLGVELETLQQQSVVARSRHLVRSSGRPDQYQPGGVDLEDGRAALGDAVEKVDEVKVLNQGVRERDKCLDHSLGCLHCSPEPHVTGISASGATPTWWSARP